jgi:hypothetical protein
MRHNNGIVLASAIDNNVGMKVQKGRKQKILNEFQMIIRFVSFRVSKRVCSAYADQQRVQWCRIRFASNKRWESSMQFSKKIHCNQHWLIGGKVIF